MALIAASLAFGSAYAIPAKQGIRTVTQPDGTTLKINVVGDEFLHYTVTEDGYVLTMDSDGFYRLAEIDASGLLVSTGVTPEMRVQAGVGITLSDLSNVQTTDYLPKAKKVAQEGLGLMYPNSKYPKTGNPRVPVFLVEFSDVKFSQDYDVKEYFTKMLTEDNFDMYGGTGSAQQYFKDQSGGKFVPQFDVYGPVTLPETQAYYGDNRGQGFDVFAHYIVSHGGKLVDQQYPEANFRNYDADGDGEIDFVYIFYAGQGEHNLGGPNTIWPHAGKIQKQADFVLLDGVWLNSYACSNEIDGSTPAGIGPLIHEYSHILGLPDLYTTDMMVNPRDFTPGQYTVLDYGVYSNDSRTPPNYTAFERNALGWNEPILIDGKGTYELDEISSGDFYLIQTTKTNEFFLFENRQLTGWDAYNPNSGMLIWHINYDKSVFENNNVNSKSDNQRVELVKANNELGFVNFADGFPFPGTSANTAYTASTTPAFKTAAGADVNFPITDIAEANGKIIFDVLGGDEMPAPVPEINSISLADKSFVVEWSPVKGAADYLVSVYEGKSDEKDGKVVAAYDNLSTEGATSLKVEGLDSDENNYHVVVKAVRATRESVSEPLDVELMDNVQSGIDGIESDSQAPAVYYNLQGLRIENPEPGSIVIERRGNQTRKIRF